MIRKGIKGKGITFTSSKGDKYIVFQQGEINSSGFKFPIVEDSHIYANFYEDEDLRHLLFRKMSLWGKSFLYKDFSPIKLRIFSEKTSEKLLSAVEYILQHEPRETAFLMPYVRKDGKVVLLALHELWWSDNSDCWDEDNDVEPWNQQNTYLPVTALLVFDTLSKEYSFEREFEYKLEDETFFQSEEIEKERKNKLLQVLNTEFKPVEEVSYEEIEDFFIIEAEEEVFKHSPLEGRYRIKHPAGFSYIVAKKESDGNVSIGALGRLYLPNRDIAHHVYVPEKEDRKDISVLLEQKITLIDKNKNFIALH
ncbi:hypothetical protein V7D15_07265 [Thermoanaerobacter thermohydrosulfuricus]